VGPTTDKGQTRLRSLWVLGHRVTPISVGDRVAVLELVTPPNTPGPPPHYHDDCAEFFYVISGQLGVMSAGEWTSLGSGGFVEVPRRVVHTFRNEGVGEARTITGYDVPGFEKWFEEFGYDAEQPGAYESSMSEATRRRVVEQSSRYHMVLAG
jgi:mannose-6-phosphate isomerase-like protein (cupin superfamily)